MILGIINKKGLEVNALNKGSQLTNINNENKGLSDQLLRIKVSKDKKRILTQNI